MQSVPVRMRKAYAGTQIAEIKLPLGAAKKLMEIGKVKVSWTVCTIKSINRPERCFKCLEFGHRYMAARAKIEPTVVGNAERRDTR